MPAQDGWEQLATARAAMARADFDAARAAFEALLAPGAPGARVPVRRELAHIGLATMERDAGRAFEALRHLTAATATLAPVPADGGEAVALVAWRELHEEAVRSYIELGVFDRAQHHLEALRRLAADDGAERVRGEVLGVDLLLAQGRFERAQRMADRILAGLGAATPDAENAADVRLLSLLAAHRRARDPAALRAIAAGLEELPDAGLRASKRYRALFDAVLAWLGAGARDRARAALARLRDLGDHAPLPAAEIAALAARLDLGSGADVEVLRRHHAALQTAFDRLCAAWRAMPVRDGGTGMLAFADRRDVLATMLELDARVLGADAFAAAYGHVEQVLSLGSLSRRLGAASPTLDEVRRRLVPPGGGVLMYVVARAGAHLLAIDADGELHESVPFDAGMVEDVFALAAAIDRPPRDDDVVAVGERALRARAAPIAARLLTPRLRARLSRWRQVLLVGEQEGAAAMHLMPWDDGWLALERELRHAPSLALLDHLARRPSAPRDPSAPALAVLGDPAHGDAAQRRWAVEPLRLGAALRNRLQEPFAGDALFARWGADATPPALADGRFGAARVGLLLAHGVADYTRERHAGVLLSAAAGAAPDAGSVLFAEDVEALRAPPVVVLGVCGASSGPLRIGDDGLGHLGGAFLAAGADAVLAARGDLPVGATLDLLRALFVELRAGRSAASALRSARRAIAADPRRAHPYYFAGLRLSGLDAAPWR